MVKNPTVSVIIPTFNRSHLLSRSIRSVINQTYQDFEIIVIDDASTDNTEELILSLDHKKIRYIRHEKNKGAAAARNTGINAARGSYIAFQDSDDEWLPEKLEKQMRIFKTYPINIGVIYTGFYKISENDKVYVPFSWITKREGNIHQELLTENFVGTPTLLVRAKCLTKVGQFDVNLPRLQDWDLVLRLSKHYDFKLIDEPLLISYYTKDSISTNQDALIKAKKIILNKYSESYKKNKKLLANHYLALGFNMNSIGDFNNSRDYFIKAIKTYPFNIRLVIHSIFSIFGKERYDKFLKNYRRLRYHRN